MIRAQDGKSGDPHRLDEGTVHEGTPSDCGQGAKVRLKGGDAQIGESPAELPYWLLVAGTTGVGVGATFFIGGCFIVRFTRFMFA